MPQVLDGTQASLNLSRSISALASHLGQDPEDTLFQSMVIEWYAFVIQDIQLQFPMLNRTLVHDAEFNLIADTAIYNVRDPVDNGGFGWDNCWQIYMLTVPDARDRPLEPLHLFQYRERAYQPLDSGPPVSWVWLDQFRVRIVPVPDQDYVGRGDYFQDLPTPSDDAGQVDWPRAWDACLREGLFFQGMRWMYQNNPAVWKAQEQTFTQRLLKLGSMDRNSPVVPRRAIQTRSLRHRRRVGRDPSADYRFGGQ